MAKQHEGLQDHCHHWSSGLHPVNPCRALAHQRGIAGLGATPCRVLARQRGIEGLVEPPVECWHAREATLGLAAPFEHWHARGLHQAWRSPNVQRWHARGALGQPAYSPEKMTGEKGHHRLGMTLPTVADPSTAADPRQGGKSGLFA